VASAPVEDALRSYAIAAIDTLRQGGHVLPPLWSRESGWTPRGDGVFIFRSPENSESLLPWDRASLRELPEYRACLATLRADQRIAPRLDTLVGSSLSASRLEAEDVPELTLSSMLSATDELVFDEELFIAAAWALIAWLTRDSETYRVLAPLSGVVAEALPIALESGVEIVEMSDDEAIDCLTTGIISGPGAGAMGFTQLGPRVALRIRDTFPLKVGDSSHADTEVFQAAHERWRGTAEAAVLTLRLLKAGNLSSPGLVRCPVIAFHALRGLPS